MEGLIPSGKIRAADNQISKPTNKPTNQTKQQAMSHIVEAGMPHVAIGYGVWICDQFEKDAGPLNLLYPKLDCKNQHKANINSTLIKHRNKNGKNPSYDERVASCTVLKEEIRTGVMSPNMQGMTSSHTHRASIYLNTLERYIGWVLSPSPPLEGLRRYTPISGFRDSGLLLPILQPRL